MKRAMNMTALVGFFVLSLSVHAEPTPGQGAKHAEEAAAEDANLRPELRAKKLAAGVPQYTAITDATPAEVKIAVTPNGNKTSEEKVFSKENFVILQSIVKDNARLRAEVSLCPAGKDDAGVKQIGALLDGLHVQLEAALFEKKNIAGEVTKPNADEKSLVATISQILSLLVKRGEIFENAKFAPYATEFEKKVATSLTETLSLVLGNEVKPAERLEAFKHDAQLADPRFAESTKATDSALTALKIADTANICRLDVPEPEVARERFNRNAVAQQEAPKPPVAAPIVKTPTPAPVENKPPAPTPDFFAGIQDYLRRSQEQLAATTQKGLDEVKRQAEELAKAQAKNAEIAKMDDKKKQDALLKELLGAKKDEKPMQQQQPQAPMAHAAPAGGGMPQPQQQQQDPMANQQQQQPQQDPNAAMMQAMAMQQMMNSQNQTQAPAPTYQIGPSNRFDDIFNSRNNRLSSVGSTGMDPVKGAMQAQQALLNELRMAGPQQGMGAPNAYGLNQQPGVGPMSNRLFSQQAPARRNQVNTGRFNQLNATSGPTQLAGSPLGRTSTIPTDLMSGGAATGVGAGLAF